MALKEKTLREVLDKPGIRWYNKDKKRERKEVKKMRELITNELINKGINHVFAESNDFIFGQRIWICVNPNDRVKAEQILNILGTQIEKCNSYTKFEVMNIKVFIKNN